MPHQEVSHLYQRAILWPKDGIDKYGQFTVGDPEEISVRWNDVERNMLDPLGNVIAVDATVIANRSITIGSRMWLGTLDDLPGTALLPTDGWHEVKAVDETVDIKGRATFREVGLVKLRNAG